MNRLLPRLLALVLGFALFTLAGCLSSSEVNSVYIHIKQVSRGVASDEIKLSVEYINENVIPIAVERTEHKVWINGKLLGTSRSNKPVGLAPTSRLADSVILVVEDKAFLQSLISSAGASYKIETRLFILSGEDKVKGKADGSGTIDFSPLAAQ